MKLTKNDKLVCKTLQKELDSIMEQVLTKSDKHGTPPPIVLMLKSGRIQADFPLGLALNSSMPLAERLADDLSKDEDVGRKVHPQEVAMRMLSQFFEEQLAENSFDGIIQISSVQGATGTCDSDELERIVRDGMDDNVTYEEMRHKYGTKTIKAVVLYYEMKLDDCVLRGYANMPYDDSSGSVIWDSESFDAKPVVEYALNGMNAYLGGTAIIQGVIS